MDAKKLNKYKKLLLEEKQRILNSSRKDLDDIKVDADDLLDETDLAATEMSQNLAFTLRDRERELLAQIDEALLRIEENHYGVCEETGEPIEEERLNTVPWTRLSLEGAEIREKRRKKYA
ncbi:MAG: TraR/DksA family transcriptional regulator [Deltaproteobacteria bacterium]|nr:TraR/DksA family transcriptional regulator [Deltaproteobacteria bacterium]